MTVLRTARLVLRPLGPGDVEALLPIVSDWEVVSRLASWPWPSDLAFLEERLAQPQPEPWMTAALLKDGALIGTAGAAEGGIGYMLARSAWRQGYMTEACTALLDFAFATTDCPQVAAGVFEGNDAAARVLRRLGFREVGQSRHLNRARGEELPMRDFLLTRANWQAPQTAA